MQIFRLYNNRLAVINFAVFSEGILRSCIPCCRGFHKIFFIISSLIGFLFGFSE
jgi:hypothetical protein